MTDIGDVVRHQEVLWKVSGRNRDFGTLLLVDDHVRRVEVPADLDLEILHSTKDWPFVAIPTKAFKYGRIVSVEHNRIMLHLFLDWVPSDMLRAGGSLFFHPTLGLQIGDVLVATHEKGAHTRISITKSFGNIKKRQRRKQRPWKPKASSTTYDRLMGKNPFEDDDET